MKNHATNHICTWFCADEKGQESIFPQTGQKSSSRGHQEIYWKCIILFFLSSKRFNKEEKHVFFTNVKKFPFLDGRWVNEILEKLDVEIIFTDFKFKTPQGYFEMFQNQFYEFSILEHITKNDNVLDNYYMILDSDCIFIKPAAPMFKEATAQGFLSFEDDCTTELVIHGLSRKDMKFLYEELLDRKINEVPGYHLGEFFMASVKNINILFTDFLKLWPQMLKRFELRLPKFNEEAQTLSYLYYKNNFKASTSRTMMKRIWTNPVFYRNVELADRDLILWHLPAEKTFGLADLYNTLKIEDKNFVNNLNDESFVSIAAELLGIPDLSSQMKLKYYWTSYYKAVKKRVRRASLIFSE